MSGAKIKIARGNLNTKITEDGKLEEGELFWQKRNIENTEGSKWDEGTLWIGNPTLSEESPALPIASTRVMKSFVLKGPLGNSEEKLKYQISDSIFKTLRVGDAFKCMNSIQIIYTDGHVINASNGDLLIVEKINSNPENFTDNINEMTGEIINPDLIKFFKIATSEGGNLVIDSSDEEVLTVEGSERNFTITPKNLLSFTKNYRNEKPNSDANSSLVKIIYDDTKRNYYLDESGINYGSVAINDVTLNLLKIKTKSNNGSKEFFSSIIPHITDGQKDFCYILGNAKDSYDIDQGSISVNPDENLENSKEYRDIEKFGYLASWKNNNPHVLYHNSLRTNNNAIIVVDQNNNYTKYKFSYDDSANTVKILSDNSIIDCGDFTTKN